MDEYNCDSIKEYKNILEILTVMRNDEKEHTFCSFGETYLKYRKVVIEWMIDVCEYFSLDPTTIHAAVAYLDRLQPNDRYTRYEWQMLAISCVLLSAKYNECEENVPDRVTLEDITQQPISNATILNYEVFALKNLSWKLNARTAMSFLSCYMTLGLLDGTEVCPEFPYLEDRKIMLHKKIIYYATITMIDHRFKIYKASDLAVAVITVVKQEMFIQPTWTGKYIDMVKTDPYKYIIVNIINLLMDIDNGDHVNIVEVPNFLPESPISSQRTAVNEDDYNKENTGPKEKNQSPISVTGNNNII